jgi:2'-hydroxyisoflavone reductase
MVAAGYEVSVLNRGKTRDELPDRVERLRGDRDEGMQALEVLASRTWDACVDVSGYTPRQVRPSAEMLCRSVKRYLFVSAVSVYGDPDHGPVDESYPRIHPAGEDVTEVGAETYGALKVACENIVQELYVDRCTILRPQVVGGPYDPIGQLSYWVQRATLGGEMLAPGDGSDHLQLIDVRDLARFIKIVIEKDLGGSFNLAGPRLTWAEFMQVLHAGSIVWVAAEIIKSAGLTFVELPLYRREGSARSSLMHVSNERATRAGLTLTDPAITVKDTRAWLVGRNFNPALSTEVEMKLIDIARRGESLSRP